MSDDKSDGRGKGVSFSARQISQLADPHIGSASVRSTADDTLLAHLREWVMRKPIRIMNIDYKPARLVRTKTRWYFLFYQTNPITGDLERHRPSYNIGHYPPEFREAKAKEILDDINSKLPYGYPYDPVEVAASRTMTIVEGIELALKYCIDLREASETSYKSWARKFLRFIDSIGFSNQPITSVNKKVAMAYSDQRTLAGVSGRSHNNDINGISTIWGVLVDREIVDKNPFSTVPRRKKQPSSRKPIPPEDIQVILQYLKEKDVSVYLSCLILYYCLIRPNEQRQLQRQHFMLDRSLIYIPAHISKNGKDDYVTIPDELISELDSLGIRKLRYDAYVIGNAKEIGRSLHIARSAACNRYRILIKQLQARNIIRSTKGNSLYSWKNTGMDALANAMTPGRSYQNQARHHSLEESERYMSKLQSADVFIKQNHRLGNVAGIVLIT